MKLPIVPFDVAKDLKELEFDWYVNWMYYYAKGSDAIVLQFSDYLSGSVNPKYGFNFNHRYSTDTNELPVSAPEQSLVVKWFRDVHGLDIFIRWCSVYYNGYVYELWKGNEFISCNEFVENLTYEEAELEGIKEAIKYLKDGRTKI